jgi:hypothetical protein
VCARVCVLSESAKEGVGCHHGKRGRGVPTR